MCSDSARSMMILVAMFVAIFPSGMLAEECWDFSWSEFGEPVGLPEGYQRALVSSGEYLYVGVQSSPLLVVLDASDPDAPYVVAQYELPAGPFGLQEAGDLLFVSQSNPYSLALYSLDDPVRPKLMATIDGIGNLDGVELVGDYLYVSTNDGVSIYDISVPHDPVTVGTFLGGQPCASLELVGGYLYVAHPGSILVFDLSDPSSPVPVGDVGFSNPTLMTPAGVAMYVASYGRLGAIDISDPRAPKLITSISAGFNPKALVVVGDELVYLNNYVLDVYDISDPNTIEYRWERPDLYSVADLVSRGDQLYMIHRTPDGMSQLEVFHAKGSVCPYLSVTDLPWIVGEAEVQGGIGYVASGYGLTVVDYTSPEQPKVLSQLTVSEDPWYRTIALSWPYAVLAETQYDPLYVVDVTDPEQPVVTDAYPLEDMVVDIVMNGDHLYMAAGAAGFIAYEILDGELNFRDSYSLGSIFCCGVEVAGQHLLGNTAYTLHVFDISDPGRLDWVASVPHEAGASFEVHGDYLFEFGSVLSVWDIEDPTQPELLGSCSAPGSTIAVQGSTAYTADSKGWLHAIDISNPAMPSRIGSLPVPSRAVDVDLVGELIVVQSLTGGSLVSLPQCQSTVSVTVPAFELVVTDAGVFAEWRLSKGDPADVALARSAGGVRTTVSHTYLGGGRFEAFDCWLPGDHRSRSYELTLRNKIVYREDVVVETQQGPQIDLSVSPNPFNPSTVVSFSTDRVEHVGIRIFDMAGRCVAVLADRVFRDGVHSVEWNGEDMSGCAVSSGTYLVLIVTERRTASVKLVLIR